MPASFQRMRHQWLSTHGFVASTQPRSRSSFNASAEPRTVVGWDNVEGGGIEDVVWKE